MYYAKHKEPSTDKYFSIIPKAKANKVIVGILLGVAAIGAVYFAYEAISFIIKLVIALAAIAALMAGARAVSKAVNNNHFLPGLFGSTTNKQKTKSDDTVTVPLYENIF